MHPLNACPKRPQELRDSIVLLAERVTPDELGGQRVVHEPMGHRFCKLSPIFPSRNMYFWQGDKATTRSLYRLWLRADAETRSLKALNWNGKVLTVVSPPVTLHKTWIYYVVEEER